MSEREGAPGRGRPRRGALIAAAALVALLAGGAGAAVGAAAGGPAAPAPSPIASDAPSPSAEPEEPRPAPAADVPAAPIPRCDVDAALADPRLGTLRAVVADAESGQIRLERGAGEPAIPASVQKVVTGAAALSVLGADFRSSTTVLAGESPDMIVLRGGGDATLSRLPSGSESVYPGAAHLDRLAADAAAAREADPATAGVPVRRILLDAGLFGGETWHESWPATERAAGWLSHITALQVDGDREDPRTYLSPRGEDPVQRAGAAFAAHFPGAVATRADGAPAGEPLAEALSPSVAELLPLMLVPSDNTVAEMLARLVAIESGEGDDLAAVARALPAALEGVGLDIGDGTVVDGSGMSPGNRLSPRSVLRILQAAEADRDGLAALVEAMPVSGESGTLAYANRFFGDNAVARGHVRAKTGSITEGYALAGVVTAEDGTRLQIVLESSGDVGEQTRTGIDTLTTAIFRCGSGLANESAG